MGQTLHGPSVSETKTPTKVFWFRQFTFQTKESNQIWNLDLFLKLERNWRFFLELIWKAGFSFGPNFAWSFIVIMRHLCVCWSNLPFTQNKSANWALQCKIVMQALFFPGKVCPMLTSSTLLYLAKPDLPFPTVLSSVCYPYHTHELIKHKA